jgi:hypothetical protein
MYPLLHAPLHAPQNPTDSVLTEETFRFLALPELWVVGLVILPAVAVFSWWNYGGLQRLEPRTRVVLASLRFLALLLILIALFQPTFEKIRYTTIQTQVHWLFDDSASMQRRDTYPDESQRRALAAAAGISDGDVAGHNRAELVAKVLGKSGGLLETLRKSHDVRMFRFSRKPLPIRSLDELTARGPRTHIGDALDLHLSGTGSANLDAVILVSDGRNNGGSSPGDAAAKYRNEDVPVFTLGIGDPNPPHNAWIVGPPGPKEALRKEEVAFDVSIGAEGLAGKTVNVTLHGARDGGAYLPLETQSAILGEDRAPVRVRMYHAFEDPGDYSLRFEVSSFPEETTIEDNRDMRFLRVNDEKIRVLYLEDIPRWEYRYIKNGLIRGDPSIETQVFLFDASRSFPQEHTEGIAPLQTLPRTREEIFAYNAILIGDVPPERLGATEDAVDAWLRQLVEFVEFGGGVGCLFGERAMPERYRGTPLEDLLPVVLEDPLELQRQIPDRENHFPLQLEHADRPHEIVRLRRDPTGNKLLWHEQLAPLVVYYPVQKAKAGADVLLRHATDTNRYGKRVIAAAGFYPRGRTFFLGTDETWRWRYNFGEMHQDTFWRNVVRYLAGSRLQRRSDRFELRLDKVILETGEQVRVSLDVRDAEYQPSTAGEFAVFFRSPERAPVKRVLRAVPGELGSFQGAFTMEEPGAFSVMVFANDNPADEVLAREDLLVKIPDREMARSSQDRDTLELVATASKGGRYLPLAQAEALLGEFRERKPFEQEVDRQTRPAWDTLWTLLAILGVLAAEWLLRKRARLV